MKKTKTLLLFLLPILCVVSFVFASCGGDTKGDDDNTEKTITGITFSSYSCDYDGTEKEILISGILPEGVTVDYENNKGTNSNTYNATATLSGEGYKTKVLTATLTINKLTYDMTGIAWNYTSAFTYDGSAKTVSINENDLPDGVSVIGYTNNEKTNAGSYTASVSFNYDMVNHNTLSLFNCAWVMNKATFDMTGIAWNYNSAFTYDGNEKSVSINEDALPQGLTVKSYTDNKKTNAGNYTASVSFNYDTANYNTVSFGTCAWVINKATFNNVEFNNGTFDYDGLSHSVAVTGTIPSTATVSYSSDVQGVTNSATEIGEYNITATLSDSNFETKQLTAKLTIKVVDDERSMIVSGNTLFFQNAKDENKLYAYNFTDKEVKKVSNDNAVDMIKNDNNKIAYVSKSLFSTIKTATYDTTTGETENTKLITYSASYIQKESDNVYYFIKNDLTQDKSGIFKIDFSTQEPTVTCLSVGKAKFLKLSGNNLYFADGSNGYKLSSINKTSINQTRTLVVDEKIKNLVLDNGVLYFTVNNLLGDYLARYTISSKVTRKLTIDAGIDMCVVNGYLYYINVDKFTTAVVGDGIYKVDCNPALDNNGKGTKIIDGGQYGVCSLTSNGTDLFYYDCNGYKLIQYSIDEKTSTDLLDGFVKPADPVPLSLGSQVAEQNGIIYYLDLWDGKTLHSYNPVTKENRRLTSDKVESFSIIGDYIYVNTVTYLVNNNLYRISLKTSELPSSINTGDCTNVVSDGTYLYYVEGGAIYKDSLTGGNPIKIFDYAADNLVLYNGTLYFCAKPKLVQTIMKIDNVATVTTLQEKVCVNDDYACDVFTIDNGTIYFRQNYGIGYQSHRLAKMNVNGTNYVEMVTEKTDPMEIIVSNGYVYYANAAATANDYCLYKIATNGTESSRVRLTSGNYVTSICIVGNKAYFIDYYTGGLQGDSHLYVVNIDGTELSQIA